MCVMVHIHEVNKHAQILTQGVVYNNISWVLIVYYLGDTDRNTFSPHCCKFVGDGSVICWPQWKWDSNWPFLSSSDQVNTRSRSLSTKLWYFYLPLIFLCAPNFSLNHSAPLRCWCFWPLLEMWHSHASSSGSRVFNNNSLMHSLCLVHQCFCWLISSFSCLKHCNLPNILMLTQVGIWIFPPPRELVCVIGLNCCRVQLM